MNYFSSNLKFLREQKHLDQQKVAEDLNVPQSTLSCWENGLRTPKIEQIIDIANYFNVDMDIVSKDYSNLKSNNHFDELELLFSKNKDILTDDDKEMIKFVVEKRKKEIDKQLGKDN